jgi:hypothetical protein
LVYVLENLGKGVPPQSQYYGYFQQFRAKYQLLLVAVRFNPKQGWGPHRPVNPLLAKQLILQQQALNKALQEEEFKEFMRKQFEEIAKQKEMVRGLLRQLVKEDDVVVVNKLIDPEPMQRWIAVLVSDRKRLQVQDKLIDLLDDPHPAVREAAHKALVRLGRSTDFGPPAKAKAKDIAAAQKSWREWHQLQVDTRFADDESPPTLTKPK